jgi:tetratricopeptide (TPR) repeat protein
MTSDERTANLAFAEEVAVRCGLPRSVVERWLERGLLAPERGSAGKPSFRAIGRARTLAQLWRAGWNALRIARALRRAEPVTGDADEALAGLLASIDQKHLCVRLADGGLVEPSGQLVFDFAAGAAAAAQVPMLRGPRDWFRIGVEAEAAGRLDDAVRAYENALTPADAEAHFNLGNCYYALRRRREAQLRFEAAVAARPDYSEAWNNLGVVRGEVGDRDGAITALRQALAIVPHYADAHYNLAEALAVTGDLEGARRHWRAYLSFDPNSRWADRVRRHLQGGGR